MCSCTIICNANRMFVKYSFFLLNLFLIYYSCFFFHKISKIIVYGFALQPHTINDYYLREFFVSIPIHQRNIILLKYFCALLKIFSIHLSIVIKLSIFILKRLIICTLVIEHQHKFKKL